jgi:hypothetical protein
MIVVQLLGGMGNQMFQYAVGRHLAVKNKAELKVDTSILLDHRPGVHVVNRHYDLDVFQPSLSIATSWDVWRYNWHGLGLAGKVAGRVHQLIVGNPTTREKSFEFDPSILSLTGEIYLAGLWQSYRYFREIKGIIRADFKLRFPLEGNAAVLQLKIESCHAVCINVRRGDYVTDPPTAQSLGFVGLDYYSNAVATLRAKREELKYFVFSDEVEWCQQNFQFLGENVTFVGHEYAGPKFSWYLELMQSCKYFVIPNSTFAWWGAWLSRSPEKTVIVPRRWFRHGKTSDNDLIPPDWIRIG